METINDFFEEQMKDPEFAKAWEEIQPEMKEKIRNIQYLARVDRAAEQLYSGNGTVHELIEE